MKVRSRRVRPLVVYSDIHGNLEALKAVDKDAREILGDQILDTIILGDSIDYGPQPNECVDFFFRNQYNVVGRVLGNHELSVLDPAAKVSSTGHGKKSLRKTKKLLRPEIVDFLRNSSQSAVRFIDVLAFHGSTNSAWDDFYEESVVDPSLLLGVNVVLFGHTHLQFEFVKDDRQYINPGSVGQPRNGDPRAQYAILYSDNSFDLRRVEYDIDKTAELSQRLGFPRFVATRLYLGI